MEQKQKIPKLHTDFNGLFGGILCLSHNETCKDEFGNEVKVYAGMKVVAFDYDADENGKEDNLIASGTVISSPRQLRCNGSIWSLQIDENGVQHESDVNI